LRQLQQTVKKVCKSTLHIIGYAAFIGASTFLSACLLWIHFSGKAIVAAEPVLAIRLVEIVLLLYGVVYGIYLLRKYVLSFRVKPSSS
jgi:hypothetical protein